MLKTLSISDLKNYNEVLKQVDKKTPIFLSKNGKNSFLIVDIETYEEQQAKITLLEKLLESQDVITNSDGWIDNKSIKNKLEL